MIDITSIATECASGLSVRGPCLCNENTFSLHDSMAALELMEKKLDCCEISKSVSESTDSNDSNNNFTGIPPRPIPTSLHEIPLSWNDLTLEDAKIIVLEMLKRMESMLNGAAVSETTFTCLYAHRQVLQHMQTKLDKETKCSDSEETNSITERLAALLTTTTSSQQQQQQQKQSSPPTTTNETPSVSTATSSNPSTTLLAQKIVFASTLALVGISHITQNIASNADIYEEEDFSIHTYGLMDFYGADDGDEILTVNALSNTIDQLKQHNNNENHERDNTTSTTKNKDNTIQLVQSILTYQLNFFHVCCTMSRLKSNDVRDTCAEMKFLIKTGIGSLKNAQSILEKDSSSNNEVESQEQEQRQALIKNLCFDLYINRPLVGNAPIRRVVFNNPIEAIKNLISIFNEIDWSVCDLLLRGNTLLRIRRLLNIISNSNVNILSRSLIILNLYFDDKLLGQYMLSDLISHEIYQLSGCPKLLLLQDEYGKSFISRLAKPIYDTLKLVVLNKNRQQSYINQVMLVDWSNLCNESHLLDVQQNETYELVENTTTDINCSSSNTNGMLFFTHYILYITVILMEHHVTLDIELELVYGHDDLSIAYWYREFLLSSLLTTLTAMRRNKLVLKQESERKEKEKQQQAVIVNNNSHHHYSKKGGKKNRKKMTQQTKATLPPTPQQFANKEDLEDDFEYLLLGIKRNMCRGTVRFIASLYQAKYFTKHIDSPEQLCYEFTTQKKCFEKRFESFSQQIQQPPALTYQDYCDGCNFSRVQSKDLLASTIGCFKSSKTMIDKLLLQIKKDNNDTASTSMDSSLGFISIRDTELLSLAKVCVGNSVFIHKLTQLVLNSKIADTDAKLKGNVKCGKKNKNNSGERKIEFDLQTNNQFCTIKIA